eukprot:356198-Chlamydomonas_euryale.AAC.5
MTAPQGLHASATPSRPHRLRCRNRTAGDHLPAGCVRCGANRGMLDAGTQGPARNPKCGAGRTQKPSWTALTSASDVAKPRPRSRSHKRRRLPLGFCASRTVHVDRVRRARFLSICRRCECRAVFHTFCRAARRCPHLPPCDSPRAACEPRPDACMPDHLATACRSRNAAAPRPPLSAFRLQSLTTQLVEIAAATTVVPSTSPPSPAVCRAETVGSRTSPTAAVAAATAIGGGDGGGSGGGGRG